MSAMISTDAVRFVKELYPRLREDDAAIERYRDAVDQLPPIVVARDGILVDGFHRWQAHRREGRAEIAAENLGNLSDSEIFTESIKRNASHGHQLTRKDKENLAGKLWRSFAHLGKEERYAEIAKILAVHVSSTKRWTKDAAKAELDELKAAVFDTHLDCRADSWSALGRLFEIDGKTAQSYVSEKIADDTFSEPPASRQHFDVWSFQNSADDAGTGSYFGKMPPQIVENLLWFYTEPGQIVFDPFAGGGTTIDVAKRMGRRVWSSDRKPSTPTLPIHTHDITTGWPADAPKKVDFVLLDPPYWQQAAGRYSEDTADLGNMPLADFMDAWRAVVAACAGGLAKGGHLAFIISPTELRDGSAINGSPVQVVDHAFEMYEPCIAAGLQPVRRIIVPYNTQQATGQQVTWARENKRLLKLYRDLVVFQG